MKEPSNSAKVEDYEKELTSYVINREIRDSISELTTLSNSEKLFPKKTKFKLFKKIILRILRPHTAIQTLFNNAAVEVFRKILNKITVEINRVSNELLSLRNIKPTKSSNQSNGTYKSQFFPTHEENFYAFQQDRFRGSFDLIKNRQRQYIPYLKTIRNLSKLYPFLEIGFGRGEFLEILKENGVKKILGVETNKMRVKEAKARGFEAKQADAVTFLLNYSGKLSGVSAFHLIEHLTFEEIFDLLYAIYHKLEDGGLVIMETPNPENLQVGSWSFYVDHTHITKLPPEFLKSLFDFIGFSKTRIVYSTPLKKNLKNEVQKMIYGPMDYAVVAYK